MKSTEAPTRRPARLHFLAACVAAALLAACGGSGFDSHPPRPTLTSAGAVDAADFGPVTVATSKRLFVFLANGQIGPESHETLRDIHITVEGPDLSFATACSDSLPQAGVCPIELVWTPSSAYVLAARVRVVSNAPDSPTTLAVRGTALR